MKRDLRLVGLLFQNFPSADCDSFTCGLKGERMKRLYHYYTSRHLGICFENGEFFNIKFVGYSHQKLDTLTGNALIKAVDRLSPVGKKQVRAMEEYQDQSGVNLKVVSGLDASEPFKDFTNEFQKEWTDEHH